MQAQKAKSSSIIVKWAVLLVCTFGYGRAVAHSLPNSKAQLIINGRYVLIQFRTPLEILEVASKRQINLLSPYSADSLKQYFLRHISVSDSLHSKWVTTVGKFSIQGTTDPIIGKYTEIITEIFLEPDNRASLRNFTLYCDIVIHQIINQSILFSVEQDWQNGVTQNNSRQIGVISWDLPTGKIFPLKIQSDQGSWFKGFKSMLALGMQHIKEGTDHLLFLIALLLPAMLLTNGKKWGKFGGIKYSLAKLLKIVTAFTIGHSITLLIGALGWLKLPSQPIEIMIAVSILVSAIHAVRPVFPGKEIYIAAGFGLVHGLAFASVLSNLNLGALEMATSILGFNIGIELMQLFVILCTIPWLIVLSQNSYYRWIRIAGAVAAMIASIAWIAERVTNHSNMIAKFAQQIGEQGRWLVLALAIATIAGILFSKVKKKIAVSPN